MARTDANRGTTMGRRGALAACVVLAAMIAGGTASADPGSDQAAQAVRSFILGHRHGCPLFTVGTVTAQPTLDTEVSDTRPAGYDVYAPISHSAGSAQFLVSGGRVYPYNGLAGTLANGCKHDPPPPRTPLDWHGLPYLDTAGAVIQAGSDGPWRGASANHRLHTGSAVLIGDTSSTPVWAKQCAPGQQTVHFKRDLYLLGPPDTMTINLSGWESGAANPFTEAGVWINGHRVMHVRQAGILFIAGRLNANARRDVRFGANAVEVVVVKSATGPCNGGSSQQFGVTFSLTGAFHSDTTGSVESVSGQGTCVSSNCMGATTVSFRLANSGPSAILEPRLNFGFQFTQPNEVNPTSFSKSESGLTGAHCHVHQNTVYSYIGYCDWHPFAAGASGTISISLQYNTTKPPDPAPFKEVWPLDWSFGSPYGSSGRGAGGHRPITACSPPGPDCSAPSS